MKSLLVMIILFQTIGCSSTDFEGLSGSKKDAKGDPDKDSSNDNDTTSPDAGDTGGNDDGAEDDGGDPTPDPGSDDDASTPDDDITEGDITKLRTKCWFAVSGAYIGDGGYSTKFPGTTSGNEIGHGEKFDTAGGVFLQAKTEPYVYQQGDKEIDVAVAKTFDSIAIAPGMHAEIRDAGGGLLFEGDGPAFVLSSDYGEHSIVIAARNHYRTNVGTYPDWMQKILNDTNFSPQRTPLHAARSVKVSKIKGESCDF